MNINIENSPQSILTMTAIYFNNFKFNRINFNDEENTLNVRFSVNDSIDNNLMEIAISFDISGENLFELSGELIGRFMIDSNQGISLEKLKTNAVAIMFPYLRTQVTLLTSQPNMLPVVLPAVNINKILNN